MSDLILIKGIIEIAVITYFIRMYIDIQDIKKRI